MKLRMLAMSHQLLQNLREEAKIFMHACVSDLHDNNTGPLWVPLMNLTHLLTSLTMVNAWRYKLQ